MLGCRVSNSDVFIFFEEDEVRLLESQKIEGTYVSIVGDLYFGTLSAELTDADLVEKVETDISKNDKEEISLMQVLIHYRSAYPRLVEKGSFGDHQGYRHVYLLDIKRGLDKNELDIYNYLKRKVNG